MENLRDAMQSKKVLRMPTPSTNRTPRLRREENPPYPEHDIQILREVLRINEGVEETNAAVKTMESEVKNQGQRVGTALRTLERHAGKLDQIEGEVQGVRRILWWLAVMSAILATAAAVFEIFRSLQ